MVEIKEVKKDYSGEKWDSCVQNGHGSFLQSWNWGLFQEVLGKKVWRVIITNNEQSFPFLIYKEQLPGRLNWIYIPQIYSDDKEVLKVVIKFAKDILKKEKSLFLYIDPYFENYDEKLLSSLGFQKKKNASIQPLDTILLPIKSDEEMFGSMHKKTRYNIRLAQKKGVEVKMSKDNEDIKNFFKLVQKTEKRQGIQSHSLDYYKKLLSIDENYLINAYFEGQLIASNIISIFGTRSVYIHGASDYSHRKLMAPFLLQWESILFARLQGCEHYDFWGIKGKSTNTKKWEGITNFKKGFTSGDFVINYIGLYIYIQRPFFYFLYRVLRPISKLLKFVR